MKWFIGVLCGLLLILVTLFFINAIGPVRCYTIKQKMQEPWGEWFLYKTNHVWWDHEGPVYESETYYIPYTQLSGSKEFLLRLIKKHNLPLCE